MLQNNPFYWGTIRKLVVAFGAVFSDIHIIRKDREHNAIQTIMVPCEFGPKEKWMRENIQNPMPGVDDQVEMVLPRMSYDLISFTYDGSRKLTSTGKTVSVLMSDNTVMKAQFNPVPYDFSFELNVMTKTIEDGLMIIEQIIPFFTPDYTIKVNDIPELQLVKELPIILNAVSHEDTWDGDFKTRRTVTWTLQFVMKAYLYPPVALKKVNIRTNILLNLNVELDAAGVAGTVVVVPGPGVDASTISINPDNTVVTLMDGGISVQQMLLGNSNIIRQSIFTLSGVTNIQHVAGTSVRESEGTARIQLTAPAADQTGTANITNPIDFVPGFQEYPVPILGSMSLELQKGLTSIQNTTMKTQSGVSNIT